MLPNLGPVFLILLGCWIVGRLVSNPTARILSRATPCVEMNLLLSRLVWIAVSATGRSIAPGVLQLDTTVPSLITGAGIVKVAAGGTIAFPDPHPGLQRCRRRRLLSEELRALQAAE